MYQVEYSVCNIRNEELVRVKFNTESFAKANEVINKLCDLLYGSDVELIYRLVEWEPIQEIIT